MFATAALRSRRSVLFALAAAALLAASGPATSQPTSGGGSSPAGPQEQEATQGDCGAPHGPYRVVRIKAGDVLNIREGPGTQFRIVFPMPPDASGIGLGRCADSGDWCEVRYLCHRGWASARFLTSGEAADEERVYRVIDHRFPDMLNVRAGTGTEFEIVARIAADARDVRISECRSVSGYEFKWCATERGGVRGWVYARYLADVITGQRPR